MAHFGSVAWPCDFGTVAIARTAAQANQAATGSGTLTCAYTVPVGASGYYLVFGHGRVTTASTAATSHAVKFRCSFNDGTAQTSANLCDSGVTPTADLKATAGTPFSGMMVIYAAASTVITVGTTETVSGTGDGAADIDLGIVRIA